MNQVIKKLAEQVLKGTLLSRQQARELSEASDAFDDMLYWAGRIRRKNFADKVKLCSIVPGRLGGCSQDCAFCAQSLCYDTNVDKKPKILSDEQILSAAAEAEKNKVSNFGIVTSGKSVTDKEIDRIAALTSRIKNRFGLNVCASLGILNEDQARRLVSAGLKRYNHNLETSRSFFPKVVGTHKYSDRISTVKTAKKAGLKLCTGGIFGMGETDGDRIEMAFELRRLKVDTVPMNFLHPIEGTPLEKMQKLPPREILRIIAIYRFILPQVNLKVAGGRVLNLRDMQSWIFNAGATSILTGSYLTTAGRAVEEDMRMIADLGLQPVEKFADSSRHPAASE